jgi:hypothetical protein
MRATPDGEVEIICNPCLKLEQNAACTVKADSRAGSLDDV